MEEAEAEAAVMQLQPLELEEVVAPGVDQVDQVELQAVMLSL